MNRSSRYHALEWIVENYDAPLHCWWQPMAAFNVDSVAIEYAKDCARSNAGRKELRYRVVHRKGRNYVTIWEQPK